MRHVVVQLMVGGMIVGAAPFSMVGQGMAAEKPASTSDFKDVEQLAREHEDFAIQVYRVAGQQCLNHGQPARAVALLA